MLTMIDTQEKISLSYDTNNDLFTDLSSEEASVFTGGYRLGNISGTTQEFATLGQTAGINKRTLYGGNEIEIDPRENYILYFEKLNPFTPKLFTVEDTGGRYRFNVENGNTVVQPF
ncbi:MAG: hypothetical protein RMZ69_17535 [Nostoc sp. ChiQUE01a]|nr:hypothetical protein [Nostoc sp. ChiQUE01a]